MQEDHSQPQIVQQGTVPPTSPQFYHQFLHTQTLHHSTQNIQHLLKHTNISYNPQQFSQQFKVQVDNHTLKFKIINLTVKVGPFSLEVSILNEPHMSRAHLLQKYIFKSSHMYVTSEEKQEFAVKCYPLKQKPLEQLALVVREYAFSRIAGCLGVGPALLTPFGFDILICSDCIEFAMQECEPIHKTPIFWNKNLAEGLKDKLKLLHSVHIIHSNIHPQNILYHPHKKQALLSDYRQAQYLQTPLGTKTKTQMLGNLDYCSEEMIRIYDGQAEEVDLLLNDAISLENTVKRIAIETERASRKRLAKEYWDIDLGELFGQNRALFHNFGMVQPKDQDSYHFMFTYFRSLNIFQDIHKYNIKILDEPIFKASLPNLRIRLLKLTKEYSSSHFMTQLKELLMAQIDPNSARRVNMGELGCHSQWDNQGSFLHKMKVDSLDMNTLLQCSNSVDYNQKVTKWLENSLTYPMSKCLAVMQDRRAIVQYPHVIKIIKKQTYYRDFLNFIQLRSCRSTFIQKSKACLTFIKTQKVPHKTQIQSTNDNPQFQCSLKHILYDTIANPLGQYHTIIPDTLANLIIMDCISFKDLSAILTQLKSVGISSIKKAVMLFSAYCALDWTTHRSINLQQHTNLIEFSRRIIYNSLLQLRSIANDELITLIALVLCSDTKSFVITQHLRTEMLVKVKMYFNEEVFDLRTARQMAALICLNSTFKQGLCSHKEYLSMLSSLSSYDPKILSQQNLDFYHLRLYAYLQNTHHDQLRSSFIFESYRKCLQHPRFLIKYKLYYCEYRKQYIIDQIPQLIKNIQNTIRQQWKKKGQQVIQKSMQKQQRYKFNSDVIFQWQYYFRWLVDHKQTQLCTFYIEKKMKDYYKSQNLLKIDFPIISDDNDFISFYQTAYSITKLYLKLMKKQENLFSVISVFLEQIQNHFHMINFDGSDQIKAVVGHYINYIRIDILCLKKQPINAINLCREGIRDIKSSTIVSHLKMKVYLLHYLEKILGIVFTQSQLARSQRYLGYVHKGIRSLGLMPLLLDHHHGFKFMWILNCHLLFMKPNLTNFFQHHLKLLEILGLNPSEQALTMYCDSIRVIFTTFGKEVEGRRDDLTNLLVNQYILKHPYFSIMLSYLMKFHTNNSPILQLIYNLVIARVSKVSLPAKRVILDNFFSVYLVEVIGWEGKQDKLGQSANQETRKEIRRSARKQAKRVRMHLKWYTKYVLQEQILQDLLKKKLNLNKVKNKLKNNQMDIMQEKRSIWQQLCKQLKPTQESSSEDGQSSSDEQVV